MTSVTELQRHVALVALCGISSVALAVDIGFHMSYTDVTVVAEATPPARVQSKQSAASSKQSKPAWLQVPFDHELTQLPPKFAGHNPEQVFSALQERDKLLAKGEFETTEAHSRRKEAFEASLRGQTLFGKVRGDSTLAFVLKAQAQYDADASTFRVTSEPSVELGIITKHERVYKPEYNIGVPLSLKSAGWTDKYQNVYGAKFDVTSGVRIQTLGMTTPREGIFERSGARVRVPMPPDQARVAKPYLGLLLVCRLSPPLEALVALATTGDPTFQRPVKIGTVQQLIQIEPLEIWAINTQTGSVYAKVKRDSQ